MRQWLGSLLFTSWLFVSVVVYGLALLPICLMGHRRLYAGVCVWSRVTLAVLGRCCDLRHEIDGRDRLPAENAVILMKHSSAWETISQFILFPTQTWVVKRELMWAPILGWVLWFLKPIAINRRGGRRAVEQVVEHGSRRLREGLWVMIYPEGTRVPAGRHKRFGLSGVLLAQAAGVPVVPVAHNAGDFWPRRGFLKRAGRIRVVVGHPIATANRDPREVTNEVQKWIESELAAMAVSR